MSDNQQYAIEKERIDFFIDKGFRIKVVEENLEGAFLVLENKEKQEETLHIKHADARKYFSSILIKQQRRENL
ncbi:hypothetical protein [Sutcliffiella rhizosphaerae]|uniref:Uncharacterized protein n=1 Tax=Sutcliffiella rhizosphaerae TaxID=2880967 RepID=A0ABN8A2Q5_9BACI|nr:hypothetical protein [Sutcliffiella rhizosphaerae]CAG9619434.1 hypothetical protein BACCIP111883_00201 [Sutcliffiella rhizosphaerae]